MDWSALIAWIAANYIDTTTPGGSFDFSTLVPWICQSLNASDVSNLTYWTEAELYQYAEEAFHDIGGKFLLIAEFDGTTALIADQGMYPVPFLHIATIFVSTNGEALRSSSVKEMEALDTDWEQAASGAVTRWIGNFLGMNFIRTYPAPDAPGTLELIFHKHPPDLTPSATQISVPKPVADYLAVKALQAARARQSDAQMLDASAAFGMLGTIYEQAIEAYWGQGS